MPFHNYNEFLFQMSNPLPFGNSRCARECKQRPNSSAKVSRDSLPIFRVDHEYMKLENNTPVSLSTVSITSSEITSDCSHSATSVSDVLPGEHISLQFRSGKVL